MPLPSIASPTRFAENSEREQPHSALSEAGSYAQPDREQEEADLLVVDVSIVSAASEGNDESLFVEHGSLIGESSDGELAK